MAEQKVKTKRYRYEVLRNFSVAKISTSDTNVRPNNTESNSNTEEKPNKEEKVIDNESPIPSMPIQTMSTDNEKLKKQRSMINLTEEEKLQLQFVLTQQNCADCGLW